MSALPLADGPAMYFGGTIMTFALPYGAFIAAAVALFYLFRARHSVPRLRWSSSTAQVTSVITREPGPAPEATAASPATPAEATGATDATPANDGPASESPPSDSPPSDSPEGKDGEPG